MDIETIKALDAMRRAVAKWHGVDESEITMTVNCRSEEVPEYFYDSEMFLGIDVAAEDGETTVETTVDLPSCSYGHDFTANLFGEGVVCEVCGIKQTNLQLDDDEETCWDCGEWEICTCFD